MPRLARVVIPGVPHHVVQRGNNRQDVFFVDDDRRAYLGFLENCAKQFGLEVLGYCLMTNHVHLVVRPLTENALAKGVGRAHFRYSQYINRFHGRVGHVWQGRFHSCALDEEHFWAAMRYVEQNPVRAGLASKAWEYPWSSAPAHGGMTAAAGLLETSWWERQMRPGDWRRLVGRRLARAMVGFLRKNTRRGWPLTTDRALAKFEKLVGRRLRPLPVGRPPGARDKKKRARRRARVK